MWRCCHMTYVNLFRTLQLNHRQCSINASLHFHKDKPESFLGSDFSTLIAQSLFTWEDFINKDKFCA